MIHLLIIFTKSSTVYATTIKAGTGHPQDAKLEAEWNQVSFFNDKYVVRIAVGSNYTLFLEDNGIVQASGPNNTNFALSWVPNICRSKCVNFINNNIKIIDIDAGYRHN